MTSILNKAVGLSHGIRPTDIKSFSERLVLKNVSNNKVLFTHGKNGIPFITTSYNITGGDSVQFAPTLGTELYAYILGNQPYTLTIQGLMFNDSEEKSMHPVQRSLRTFNQYKASTHQIVNVAIGDIVFKALLENISITGAADNGTDIFSFKLVLRGVMNDNKQ